jgi:hypothetical protein
VGTLYQTTDGVTPGEAILTPDTAVTFTTVDAATAVLTATVLYVPVDDVSRTYPAGTAAREDYDVFFAYYAADGAMPPTQELSVDIAVVQTFVAPGDLTAPSGRAAFSLAGQALYLDGEDDEVEVDLPPLPETSDFSVEVWFKSSGPLVADATLVDLVQVFRVYFTKQGGVSLSVHTQDVEVPLTVHSPYTTLNDGAWHHVAGAWTHLTKTATLYVDGVEASSDSFGGVDGRGGLLPLSTLLFLGRAYTDTSSSYFNGFVDDVRLWRKALDATHVAAHMNTALSGTEKDLLVYYQFDQKATYAGSAIKDATAGGYDGVFNGGDEDPIFVSSTAPLFMLTQTTVEDVPLVIPLAGTDVDFDSLSFVITSLPTHGQLSTARAAQLHVRHVLTAAGGRPPDVGRALPTDGAHTPAAPALRRAAGLPDGR